MTQEGSSRGAAEAPLPAKEDEGAAGSENPPLDAEASEPAIPPGHGGSERDESQGSGQVATPPSLDLPALLAALENLGARIGSLEDLVRQRLLYDEAKERILRSLSDELDAHRSQASRQPMRRFLTSLLSVHDAAQAAAARASEGEGRELRDLLEKLLDLLAYEDVLPIGVASGDVFDPTVHRALRRVETGEVSAEKTIHEVYRSGFRWEDRVLRPAEVSVLRFKPPMDSDRGAADAGGA
jgi:molecular chaperone GrpE